MSFKDYFSKQSAIYAKARPTYPDELFAWLSSLAAAKDLCWDCATGNGQAAIPLAHYFKKVIATDGSRQQISNATKADNIEYRIATAEQSGIETSTADLITVATAAHWFNLDAFYKEAQRVAKPDGVLAVWTYGGAVINKEVNELMQWFMYEFLMPYWPQGREYVMKSYANLPFPFAVIDTPQFYCRLNLNLAQWLDYVKSWSSYNNYAEQTGKDPIEQLLPQLSSLWPENEVKEVVWPLHLKCAYLNRQP